MDEKTTTTIAVAISSENLSVDFCLITWLFRLLGYVEKNKISLKFLRITPYVSILNEDISFSMTKKRARFMLLIEFSFVSSIDQSLSILEEFIRNSLAHFETNFELVKNQDSIQAFSLSLFRPLLYYCTDRDHIDFSRSSIFRHVLKNPYWSLNLSDEWMKFFSLHKNDSSLIPGARGFLDLPRYIELSESAQPFEFECPLKQGLFLSSLFNESILDNIFSILVKPENLRYLNFQDYHCIFEIDNTLLIHPQDSEGFYCSTCEGLCHLYKSCHAFEPYRGEHRWDSDFKEFQIPSNEDLET